VELVICSVVYRVLEFGVMFNSRLDSKTTDNDATDSRCFVLILQVTSQLARYEFKYDELVC
jgi:hypothetical protein